MDSPGLSPPVSAPMCAEVQTILAFDFGSKRIGVAIGNTLTASARPLTILDAVSRQGRFEKIAALIKEWQPHHLVVGLPLSVAGTAHQMTQQCQRFANQLKGRFNLPVSLVDERYSSVIVEQSHGTRFGQHVDAQAAALILQQYFDQPPPKQC